jgi:adenine-specific DNA glycosylase
MRVLRALRSVQRQRRREAQGKGTGKNWQGEKEKRQKKKKKKDTKTRRHTVVQEMRQDRTIIMASREGKAIQNARWGLPRPEQTDKDAKKTGPGDVAEEQNMVNADKHFVAKIPKGRPIGRVTG